MPRQTPQIDTLIFMIIDQRLLHSLAQSCIVSSTMSTKPSRKLQSVRDLFRRRASSQLTPSPTCLSELPDSRAGVSTFGNFIDGIDARRTVANTVYNGSKILLDVIDKVGYAVPPLKAAAAGIRHIITVVDVCTSHLETTMLSLTTPASQNVVQNKKDYEAIAQKLEAIITIVQKYQQHGCQRAIDRRIEDLSKCVVS